MRRTEERPAGACQIARRLARRFAAMLPRASSRAMNRCLWMLKRGRSAPVARGSGQHAFANEIAPHASVGSGWST